MSKRCVLFQPLNGIGLGHMSRLAAIALALRASDPTVKVLFGVDGGAHLFLESLGLPVVAIPHAHGSQDVLWTGWRDDERVSLKQGLADAILRHVDPRVVVFDVLPSEAFLEAALSQKRTIVLCMRPVKDAEAYFRRVAPVMDNAHLFILPCTPTEWLLPEHFMTRASFVGQVTRLGSNLIAANANNQNRRNRVLISGGGGGHPDTCRFYNLASKAACICQSEITGLEVLLVAGPLFHDWLSLDPITGVHILPFADNLTELWATASVAIIQGGYNTVCEVIATRTPAVCVPATRTLDDQHGRARTAAKSHPEFRVLLDPSPESLAEEVKCVLSTPKVGMEIVRQPADGAHKAGEILRRLILEGDRSDPGGSPFRKLHSHVRRMLDR